MAVLIIIHDADHVRQGRPLPPELYVVAIAALLSIATTLTVLARYPTWGRTVAIGEGIATVLGVSAVHVAPQWSTVTDSYAAADADVLSWAIIVAMMLAGLALAAVAARSDT